MPSNISGSGEEASPVELQRLRAFQRQVDWLRNSRLMDNPPVRFSFETICSVDSGTTARKFAGYDNEQFLAILPVLRQFILNNEPVQMYGIYNIVMKYCDRNEVREWVKYARREWQDTLEDVLGNHLVFFTGRDKTKQAIHDLFYGLDGLFHIDLEMPMPDEQSPLVNMATLQRCFPRLWIALRNMDASIHFWLDAPGEEIPLIGGPYPNQTVN